MGLTQVRSSQVLTRAVNRHSAEKDWHTLSVQPVSTVFISYYVRRKSGPWLKPINAPRVLGINSKLLPGLHGPTGALTSPCSARHAHTSEPPVRTRPCLAAKASYTLLPPPAPYPPDLSNPTSPSGLSVGVPPPRSLPRYGPGFQATPVLPGIPLSRPRKWGLPALLSAAPPLPAQGPRSTRPSASLTEHPQSGRLHRGSRRGRLSGPHPHPLP